jgi:hypothetical protein
MAGQIELHNGIAPELRAPQQTEPAQLVGASSGPIFVE